MSCRATPRVLIADDQPDVLTALRLLLRQGDFDSDSACSPEAVRERLRTSRYDLLLMDLNYARDTTSGREGLDLLKEMHERDRGLPIIVMTGWGSIDTAVEAMRLGARTFVHKPWDNAALTRTIRREVEHGLEMRRADAFARRETESARLVQRALMPSTLPSLHGCDVAGVWQPASTIGGDCYDAFRFADTSMGISIADVAGKGLPAALVMANLQASIRAFAEPDVTPESVAAGVNRLVCRNVNLSTLITFFYAVIDCATDTVTFTNAGHNPPILMRSDGSIERLAAGGTVLGLSAETSFDRGTATLRPGDRLVLFTDGITEAERADEAEFGDDRLIEALQSLRHLSARELVESLIAEVREFTGGAFRDDATLVCVAIG
jgi:sigma-B regulation protein RsbU (phosphoserine phosphatase)